MSNKQQATAQQRATPRSYVPGAVLTKDELNTWLLATNADGITLLQERVLNRYVDTPATLADFVGPVSIDSRVACDNLALHWVGGGPAQLAVHIIHLIDGAPSVSDALAAIAARRHLDTVVHASRLYRHALAHKRLLVASHLISNRVTGYDNDFIDLFDLLVRSGDAALHEVDVDAFAGLRVRSYYRAGFPKPLPNDTLERVAKSYRRQSRQLRRGPESPVPVETGSDHG